MSIKSAQSLRLCACGCGAQFIPTRPLQNAYSLACALRIVEQKKAKAIAREERKALAASRTIIRTKKEAIKTVRELRNEAQTAFNAWIRWRDRDKPCVCCGKPFEPMKFGGTMDAGHFRSIGSAPHLRFNEDNCHGQRKSCNRPGGTTYGKYKKWLVKRIGLARVEALEADQEPRRYRAEDYRRIRDEYRAKLRAAKKADQGVGGFD